MELLYEMNILWDINSVAFSILTIYVCSGGILKDWRKDGIKHVDTQHVTNSQIFFGGGEV